MARGGDDGTSPYWGEGESGQRRLCERGGQVELRRGTTAYWFVVALPRAMTETFGRSPWARFTKSMRFGVRDVHWGTCGSGWRTAGMSVMRGRPRTGGPGRLEGIADAGCCVAARGSDNPRYVRSAIRLRFPSGLGRYN